MRGSDRQDPSPWPRYAGSGWEKVTLFLVGPVGLFVVGGIWSALHGWLESEDAAARAGESEPA